MEQLERYQWVILFFVGAALVAALAYLLLDEDEPVTITINPPLPTATHTPSATPAPLEIYVTGAVANPESRLSMPPGTRVEDAIAAAGGAAQEADLSRVNLAARLQDGDHIHVPTTQEEGPAITQTPNAPRVVNLNTAPAEELESLPRIGPALAEAIIEYRNTHNGFESVEELMEVSGIGEATFEGLKELITVE